jgi:hypothetical protein
MSDQRSSHIGQDRLLGQDEQIDILSGPEVTQAFTAKAPIRQ